MSVARRLYGWVDPSLNYGRETVEEFVKACGDVRCILDIAAGAGEDLRRARRARPGARLMAIDCIEPSVRRLQAEGMVGHRLDIERDELPVEPGAVDLVIANQVLEHTKEIFWIFHQITRSLRVGGHVILGVPNLASLHNRVLLAVGAQPTPIRSASAHVRGFTKPDVMDFLGSCFPGGFELIRFAGANFYPFPPGLARPLARAFPTLAWANFFLLRKCRDYHGEFLRFPVHQQLETNFFVGRTGADQEAARALE